MKLLTRIIACSLAVVITFSAYAAPKANASLVGDVIVTYDKSSFAKYILNYGLTTAGGLAFGPVGGFIGGLASLGIESLAAYYAAGYTDDDLLAAEQEYNSSLDQTLIFSDTTLVYRCSAGRSSGTVYYALDENSKMVETSDTAAAVCAIDWNYGPEKVEYTVLPLTQFYTTGFAHIYCRMPDLVADGTYAAYFPDIKWAKDMTRDGCSNSIFTYTAGDIFSYLYHSTPSRYEVTGSANINKKAGELFEVWVYPYSGNVLFEVDQVYSGYLYYPILVSKTLVSPPDNGNPEPSTRPTSFTQAIQNHNTNNNYVNNINNVNYYLAPADQQPTASNIVSPVIYDEETLVFTEPATGAQYQTTGWSYDYTTRTYDITLDAGTMTVHDQDVSRIVSLYGDDQVQITYYNASGSVLAVDEYSYVIVSSGTHEHAYSAEITAPASCTLAGTRTYACSCGDSYTKSIPATGHNWSISSQVNASYDPATGELLQAGYVIYSCSTCGQQYKDDSNTGPPSSGSSGSSGEDSLFGKLGELLGTAGSGVLDLISSAIGKLLDGAIALLEMAFEKLGRVVEILLSLFDAVPQLFGGYLDMFGAVFAFIPEDIITLLTFGVACVIILGIWKMTRR